MSLCNPTGAHKAGFLRVPGMAQCRRQMGALNEANITPEAVEDVLCVAKPYLLAYKKHSATAANLLIGCTIYRCNLHGHVLFLLYVCLHV